MDCTELTFKLASHAAFLSQLESLEPACPILRLWLQQGCKQLPEKQLKESRVRIAGTAQWARSLLCAEKAGFMLDYTMITLL